MQSAPTYIIDCSSSLGNYKNRVAFADDIRSLTNCFDNLTLINNVFATNYK